MGVFLMHAVFPNERVKMDAAYRLAQINLRRFFINATVCINVAARLYFSRVIRSVEKSNSSRIAPSPSPELVRTVALLSVL